MADELVSATGNGGKIGSALGEEVVSKAGEIIRFLDDIDERVRFVADGLKADEPNTKGAELILWDISRAILELVHENGGEALPGKARELAAIAGGQAPLLPETHKEVKLFEALKEARGHWHGLTARNFMCDAALEAFSVFKEQYAEPFPREEAVAAVVGKAQAGVPEAEAIPTNPKEGHHE